MEWIVVLILLVTVCVLSLIVLLSFRWGRWLLFALLIGLALPVFYMVTEVLSFYVVGRSMVPGVGVFWGVFFPAPSYFKPILSMQLKPNVLRYCGTFRCRHLGRHQLVLEVPVKRPLLRRWILKWGTQCWIHRVTFCCLGIPYGIGKLMFTKFGHIYAVQDLTYLLSCHEARICK